MVRFHSQVFQQTVSKMQAEKWCPVITPNISKTEDSLREPNIDGNCLFHSGGGTTQVYLTAVPAVHLMLLFFSLFLTDSDADVSYSHLSAVNTDTCFDRRGRRGVCFGGVQFKYQPTFPAELKKCTHHLSEPHGRTDLDKSHILQ